MIHAKVLLDLSTILQLDGIDQVSSGAVTLVLSLESVAKWFPGKTS